MVEEAGKLLETNFQVSASATANASEKKTLYFPYSVTNPLSKKHLGVTVFAFASSKYF